MNRRKNASKRTIHPLLWLLPAILIILMLLAAAFFLIGFDAQEKNAYEQILKQEVSEMTAELTDELDQLEENETQISPEAAPGIERDAGDASNKEELRNRLVASYDQVLKHQQSMAVSMVNNLAAQALSDYRALKASGEDSKANLSKLASEYFAKASIMESQVDSSFNAVLGKMETQLEAQGIDPDPIISQYQAEYKKIKAANRKAMMDQMMAQF